jgi:hypothetical protein
MRMWLWQITADIEINSELASCLACISVFCGCAMQTVLEKQGSIVGGLGTQMQCYAESVCIGNFLEVFG